MCHIMVEKGCAQGVHMQVNGRQGFIRHACQHIGMRPEQNAGYAGIPTTDAHKVMSALH